MENKIAKQIINEALDMAIKKGCFNLVEVSNVVKALEKINEENTIEFEGLTED